MFSFAQKISAYFPFWLRKQFREKIIIIESDDWGLECATSIDAINLAKNKFSASRLTRWTTDALESDSDLDALYSILKDFQTKFQRGPVITANFITHNIDYSRRDKLSFLPITKGFNNSSGRRKERYLEGITNRFIHPQCHGYCHYRTDLLETYYRSSEGQEFFKSGFLPIPPTIKDHHVSLEGEASYLNQSLKTQLEQALHVFKEFFGYSAISFIPPRFIVDKQIFSILRSYDIHGIQACNRLVTSANNRWRIPYFRKWKGLFFSPRNARLDPHLDYNFTADTCLMEISKAFHAHIPACIDFHRVNFAGTYAPIQRQRTLMEFKKLLKGIQDNWPDCHFLTTAELLSLCLPKVK